VLAGVGRFGPYVKHTTKYKTIPADESVLEIGMNRAVALLAEAKDERSAAAPPPAHPHRRQHPADESAVELYEGRYGPYVKHAGINATVPRDLKPDELTLGPGGVAAAERRGQGSGQETHGDAAKKAATRAGQRRRRDAAGPQGRQEEGGPQAQGRQGPQGQGAEPPPRTGTDG
jgi:DNA topoisomerase-1